jgi:CubicO group peptidase (beta-lactamase class C family)
VAEYWPEFAAGGEARVTVAHLLTHSAGLHRIRSIIDRAERMFDWDHMVDALARATPAYEPGTQNGYHALTYGWLVGEVVRRVSGQPLDRFVQNEIAEALGLDGLYLGCPPAGGQAHPDG